MEFTSNVSINFFTLVLFTCFSCSSMDKTIEFTKTQDGRAIQTENGPSNASLTSKLTNDCFFVHDLASTDEEKRGWKFINGGKKVFAGQGSFSNKLEQHR